MSLYNRPLSQRAEQKCFDSAEIKSDCPIFSRKSRQYKDVSDQLTKENAKERKEKDSRGSVGSEETKRAKKEEDKEEEESPRAGSADLWPFGYPPLAV